MQNSILEQGEKNEKYMNTTEYYRNWYKQNGRNRTNNYADIITKWQSEHPDRLKIHGKVHQAIKEGLINIGTKCSDCGKADVKLLAHHEDYSKPLEVVWLCYSCHKIRHAKITTPNK